MENVFICNMTVSAFCLANQVRGESIGEDKFRIGISISCETDDLPNDILAVMNILADDVGIAGQHLRKATTDATGLRR